MNLTKGIARLQGIRDKLADPWAFYRAHLSGWRELAERTAAAVLQSTAPDTSEDWQRTVAIAAQRIGATLLPIFDAAGVVIYLERTQRRHFDDAFQIFFAGELSLEEVTLYVEAGRRGDPWGKRDFTEEDRAKEDWQIAENILESIRDGGSEARAALIREFLGRRLGEELGERMPAILAAWKEAFTVQVKKDWLAWWKK